MFASKAWAGSMPSPRPLQSRLPSTRSSRRGMSGRSSTPRMTDFSIRRSPAGEEVVLPGHRENGPPEFVWGAREQHGGSGALWELASQCQYGPGKPQVRFGIHLAPAVGTYASPRRQDAFNSIIERRNMPLCVQMVVLHPRERPAQPPLLPGTLKRHAPETVLVY